MVWRIEFEQSAAKDLKKIDPLQRRRVLTFLSERVSRLENPRSIGEALKGSALGDFWKYRVGNYRIISSIEDEIVLILVLRVGHRKEIYRSLLKREKGHKK